MFRWLNYLTYFIYALQDFYTLCIEHLKLLILSVFSWFSLGCLQVGRPCVWGVCILHLHLDNSKSPFVWLLLPSTMHVPMTVLFNLFHMFCKTSTLLFTTISSLNLLSFFILLWRFSIMNFEARPYYFLRIAKKWWMFHTIHATYHLPIT
jgi:hypothetical protein